jgi:predicted lactoylglutathione lyase
MIAYLTVGSNDLPKATEFYDKLLSEIGGVQAYSQDGFIGWSFGENTPMFAIVKPFDENSATVGNGVMVSFSGKNPETVDKLHAQALSLGGTDEGAPGIRGEKFYVGYFRDLDGNKMNFFCYVETAE